MKKSMTRRMWNYLRVRGEYSNPAVGTIAHQELPPRARRIPPMGPLDPLDGGTTSACAENTRTLPVKWCGWRNYLRVRGEYTLTTPSAKDE